MLKERVLHYFRNPTLKPTITYEEYRRISNLTCQATGNFWTPGGGSTLAKDYPERIDRCNAIHNYWEWVAYEWALWIMTHSPTPSPNGLAQESTTPITPTTAIAST